MEKRVVRSVTLILMCCVAIVLSPAQETGGWKPPALPYVAAGLGTGAGVAGGRIMSVLYGGDPRETVPVFAVSIGSSVGTTMLCFRYVGSEKLWLSPVGGAIGGASAAAVSCGPASVMSETIRYASERRSYLISEAYSA